MLRGVTKPKGSSDDSGYCETDEVAMAASGVILRNNLSESVGYQPLTNTELPEMALKRRL